MEQLQAEKVPSSVQEVPGRFEETWSGLSERAHSAAQYTNEAVHANPWTSIGVGFGFGVVIGALVALAASRYTR
jgi:ElaB/YqjD/DUF883 family membrane-anchored ribosome-binding protein